MMFYIFFILIKIIPRLDLGKENPYTHLRKGGGGGFA